MRPKQTLDLLESVKAPLSYPFTRRYIHAFIESVRVSGGSEFPGRTEDERGENFLWFLETGLKNAEAYFVTDEMNQLVQWAATSLEDSDPFDRELWPSDSGFLVIDDGYVSTERRGRKVVNKALFWTKVSYKVAQSDPRASAGMMCVWFTDVEDPRDEVNAELIERFGQDGKDYLTEIRAMGRLQITHVEIIPFGAEVGPEVVIPKEEQVRVEREFGTDLDLPLAEVAHNPTRYVLACLMLMNQTIAAVERTEPLNKKQASRWSRKNLPTMVTVVNMRRIAGSNRQDGESRVEWHRRWIVKGHWRKQPYADGVVRKIWIAPYVKNAHRTDLPFVVPKKVYSLSR